MAGPIEASRHFFIMKLEKKQEKGYRPLDEVQEQVRKDIRDGRRRKALVDLDAEIARQVSLVDASSFVDYCLDVLYQRVHAQPFAP
ncbi:MAG: hypothetical protein A2Y76_12390 [Planctomycetes bacterium RBG_13_60_9]|nr:MAG: hypothetical protein A2Y76_12390 [Planctomycetes bacterium RBG_13_60_9]